MASDLAPRAEEDWPMLRRWLPEPLEAVRHRGFLSGFLEGFRIPRLSGSGFEGFRNYRGLYGFHTEKELGLHGFVVGS